MKALKTCGVIFGAAIILFLGLLVLIGILVDAPVDTDQITTPSSNLESSEPRSTANLTPTVFPTATPIPMPISIELADLLNEYEQNGVRANARFRYQANGKTPVMVTGYVDDIEPLYVDLVPTQAEFHIQNVRCSYADVRVALQLTKGQLVSVLGKVQGEDLRGVKMFGCEFQGVGVESAPRMAAHEVRQNVVQVFCVSDSPSGASYVGSGIILDAGEGRLLTVHHLIEEANECKTIELEVPGLAGRVPATVVKHCASIDRALLSVAPQQLAGLSLPRIVRAAAPAAVDQDIYSWGYGEGELRMITGMVRTIFFDEDYVTDARFVPGDSGSPVFNEYGHLLGTVSRSNSSDRAVFTGDECK